MKRFLDIALSVFLLLHLLCALPLFVFTHFYLTRSSLFSRKLKLGQEGILFTIIEINCDFNFIHIPSYLHRISFLYRDILIRYHLFRIPQIINVIRGDMSFVGPQPLSPSQWKTMQIMDTSSSIRYMARPGIIGGNIFINNISASNDEEAILSEINWDIAYINTQNIIWDILIMICAYCSLMLQVNIIPYRYLLRGGSNKEYRTYEAVKDNAEHEKVKDINIVNEIIEEKLYD